MGSKWPDRLSDNPLLNFLLTHFMNVKKLTIDLDIGKEKGDAVILKSVAIAAHELYQKAQCASEQRRLLDIKEKAERAVRLLHVKTPA